MAFGYVDEEESESEGEGGETEHLGVVAVAFQDGKVDLLLDVEKVEARWETKVRSFCFVLSCDILPLVGVKS